MSEIMDKILERTRERVRKEKEKFDTGRRRESELRDFRDAVKKGFVIAELKPASPSRGNLRPFEPELAKDFEKGGACAVSVLTEPSYFKGSLKYIEEVKKRTSLPVLRKDFILEPFQIHESYVCGADAVLLIAHYVKNLGELIRLADGLGMGALVEVHSREDVRKALDAGANIIGINNRNLETMETDLSTTEELVGEIPSGIITVSESGITNGEQAKRMRGLGVNAILVGTSLMLADDVEQKVREFSGA